jgi:cystathionine gamma-lyase
MTFVENIYSNICNLAGLKSHPQHKLALKQQYGNSGGIGIYLKGGLKESFTFLKSMKLVVLAPSIGTDFSVANIP